MNLQESIRRILREEIEDITRKILNFLKRRFKVEKRHVIDERTWRIVKTLIFEKNGRTWAIEKGLNERHQIAIILDFLITFEVIDPFNIYKRDFDHNEQKIVDTIKIFIHEVLNMNLEESIRRILREEFLNETKFFLRRIKLDDVKRILPLNAEQVYYETENYGQFKYELTLRAVEAIMYNEYELGWEDLPQQEEIDFVTDVSDMFEDKIKSLYNHYKKRQ